MLQPRYATNVWTLHQLRHSALTYAAEDGPNTPILLAVARYVAEHDSARRRR